MLWMFTLVQKYLQIPTFSFYGRSACSLLFMGVVVKLSSALDLPPWSKPPSGLSAPYLALMYKQ